jgi:hypothetical protein
MEMERGRKADDVANSRGGITKALSKSPSTSAAIGDSRLEIGAQVSVESGRGASHYRELLLSDY